MESAEDVVEQFLDAREYFAETSQVLEIIGNLVWVCGAGNTTSLRGMKNIELYYHKRKGALI